MNSALLLCIGSASATWVGMAIDDPRSSLGFPRGLRITSFAARGFVFGVCAWQATIAVFTLFAPAASVGLIMLIFLGASAIWVTYDDRVRRSGWTAFRRDRLAALACVGLIAAVSEAVVSNTSGSDSFHFVSLAGLIGRGELDLAVWDTMTRSFGISAVHAPSVITDQLYFDGFSMVIAIATSALLFVGVASHALSAERLPYDWSLVAGSISVSLLWMPYIWRYNSSYVNSHPLVAAVVLVMVIWMRERTMASDDSSSNPWSFTRLGAVSLLLGSLAMTRAEGPYFVALAGVVIVWMGIDALAHRPLIARTAAALTLFGVAAIWQFILVVGADVVWGDGFAGILSATRVDERADFLLVTALPLILYIAVGLLTAALPLFNPVRRPWLYRLVPLTGLAGVLLLNVGSVVTARSKGWASITSTYENVLGGAGGWGVIGAAVLCAAPVFALIRGWRVWNELTLLAYLPFLVVPLGTLRSRAYVNGDIPFRVGLLDSMNRILVHFYPLALLTSSLFVLTALSNNRNSRNETLDGNSPNADIKR